MESKVMNHCEMSSFLPSLHDSISTSLAGSSAENVAMWHALLGTDTRQSAQQQSELNISQVITGNGALPLRSTIRWSSPIH